MKLDLVSISSGDGNVSRSSVTVVDVPSEAFVTLSRFLEHCAQYFGCVPSSSAGHNFTHLEYVDDEGDTVTVRDNHGFDVLVRLMQDWPPGQRFQIAVVSSSVAGFEPVALTRFGQQPAFFAHVLQDETAAHRSSRASSGNGSSSATVSTIGLNPAGIDPSSLKNLDILGHGQSGAVYKALDIVNDRLMAVKCYSLDVSADVQEQIIAETDLLRKVELMDGGSLDGYGALPSGALQPTTACVVRGLDYLWSQLIMHRDIKPGNILVNSAGRVKLCDFGVSKRLEKSIAQSYVGTTAYMAPERIFGGEYSLGVTLFELAVGEQLFTHIVILNEDDVGQRLTSVGGQLAVTGAGPLFAHLVTACLKITPADRPLAASLTAHPYISQHDPIEFDSIKQVITSSRLMS